MSIVGLYYFLVEFRLPLFSYSNSLIIESAILDLAGVSISESINSESHYYIVNYIYSVTCVGYVYLWFWYSYWSSVSADELFFFFRMIVFLVKLFIKKNKTVLYV